MTRHARETRHAQQEVAEVSKVSTQQRQDIVQLKTLYFQSYRLTFKISTLRDGSVEVEQTLLCQLRGVYPSLISALTRLADVSCRKLDF